jgi:hypothetical protein
MGPQRERVKIPASPIIRSSAEPSAIEKITPSHTAEENSRIVVPKETPRGGEKTDGKGAGKADQPQ